jgi:hypothetical protein
VVYGNIELYYLDVPAYIPSHFNNGEGISWKPKEVQVPQLLATHSPSVLYQSGSTLALEIVGKLRSPKVYLITTQAHNLGYSTSTPTFD